MFPFPEDVCSEPRPQAFSLDWSDTVNGIGCVGSSIRVYDVIIVRSTGSSHQNNLCGL